jgi:hypothetical protein
MRKRILLASLVLPAALAVAAGPATLSGVKKNKPAQADAKKGGAEPGGAAMSGDSMMGGTMMGMGGAGDISPEHAKFFTEKIQPILANNCYKCHSLAENKIKGGLVMDTREGLRKGGDSGAVIKPGSPEASMMITAIEYKDPDMQMPPKSTGGKLPDADIALLKEWVKMGAPDPRKAGAVAVDTKLTGLTDKARLHWAYQPIRKPAVPKVKNAAWGFTPIDAFIMEKIEEKGLVPSPVAAKATLIRRAYMDLIGLPPTPKEIDAFEKDESPQAFAKVVERLLASPHYGERWARYWLDTARYADTVGGNRDADRRDYRYPYAWTYRDWVINALNQDMPYDQFIVHQLAADKVPNNDRKHLAALGFITVGERFGNQNDDINDKIDVVTKGFLGLTVSCARCHDHMFDPIPTKDYYALHGVFSSIYEPEDQPLLKEPDPEKLKEFETRVETYTKEDRETFFKVLSEWSRMFRQKAGAYIMAAHLSRGGVSEKTLLERERLISEEKLDEQFVGYVRGRMGGDDRVWGPLRTFMDLPDGDYDFLGAKKAQEIANEAGKRYNKYIAEKFRGLKPDRIEDILEIYGKVFEEIDPKADAAFAAARNAKDAKSIEVERDILELAGGIFRIYASGEIDSDRIRGIIQGWPLRMRNQGRYNFAAINELKLTHDGSPAKAMIVADHKDPRNSPVFIRGQAETHGDTVPRGFLEVLSPGGRRLEFSKGSGRLELAQAIANKENPLTARVLVNRVWMHHFGEGFVRTPDDLGTQAEKPSHPELIDYLSHWFINEGKWSLKNLHRFIMLSKVYQMRSFAVKGNDEIDPDNRFLWRANVRRLDFEAMRDSLLVMSGKLDPTLGGQPVNLTDEPYSFRRSIYGYIDRGNLPDLMAHFDFSDPHMTNSKRTTTIVPQQALFLMNSPFSVDVARSIVARPEVRNQPNDIQRVHAIYKIVFSRLPRPFEVEMAFTFLREEGKAAPQLASAMSELTQAAQKKLEERQKREQDRRMDDGLRAIRNEGDWVARKPLTEWETYVHALLLSNEAAYVN